MNKVSNIVGELLNETSVPRLREANPDLYKQFVQQMGRIKSTLKYATNLKYGEIETTSILFKINNPYTKKEMKIPVSIIGDPKGTMGIGIQDVINNKPIIYVSVPGVYGKFIDNSKNYKKLEDFLWPIFIHELVHVIDPTTTDHEGQLDKYQQATEDPGAHFSSKIERNAYMSQLITILEIAIEKGILSKEEIIDALRRGNDEQVKDWIVKAAGDTGIESALLYWYKQPNIMREVRMRLYNALN